MARLALAARFDDARALLRDYASWFGPRAVYVELHQNFLHGDTLRNRLLAGLAREIRLPIVATNDVHYHAPERARLQHALAAARLNTTLDRALPHLRRTTTST